MNEQSLVDMIRANVSQRGQQRSDKWADTLLLQAAARIEYLERERREALKSLSLCEQRLLDSHDEQHPAGTMHCSCRHAQTYRRVRLFLADRRLVQEVAP